jgi:hypothetical protein
MRGCLAPFAEHALARVCVNAMADLKGICPRFGQRWSVRPDGGRLSAIRPDRSVPSSLLARLAVAHAVLTKPGWEEPRVSFRLEAWSR